MSDATFSKEWLDAIKQSPRQADVKDVEDLVDILEALESALKAKDKELKELAEECLPYLAEQIDYLIACAPVSQRDEACKLAAKLKLLVNK